MHAPDSSGAVERDHPDRRAGLRVDLPLALAERRTSGAIRKPPSPSSDLLERRRSCRPGGCSRRGSRGRAGTGRPGSRPGGAGSSAASVSSDSVSLARSTRRTSTPWPAATSRGPTSSRKGTPRSSQWLYLKPGDSSRQSTLNRNGPEPVWTSASGALEPLDRAPRPPIDRPRCGRSGRPPAAAARRWGAAPARCRHRGP